MGIKLYIKRKLLKLLKSEKNIVPQYVTKYKNELLNGKTALIAGGSGGIGYAIAKTFCECGARVIIAGTNEDKLRENCRAIGQDRAKYIIINMLEVSSFADKIEEAASMFDGGRIDILVNSAGRNAKESMWNVTEESFDSVIDVNLKGCYFMALKMGEYMRNNKIRGHILNVSSASALKPAWSPYEISKWGVRGLTLGLADEFIRYGIVVNAIGPGPVATKMLEKEEGDPLNLNENPAKRFATAEEIAQLAVYMASDMGDLIVGDTFYITGGSGTVKLR